VFIEDGRITKGHPSLTGRRIDARREEPVEVPGSKQREWARGNERAQWGKQARQAGLDPADLHQLDADIRAHCQAFVADEETTLYQPQQMIRSGSENLMTRIAFSLTERVRTA
jgi:hypothetical protein